MATPQYVDPDKLHTMYCYTLLRGASTAFQRVIGEVKLYMDDTKEALADSRDAIIKGGSMIKSQRKTINQQREIIDVLLAMLLCSVVLNIVLRFKIYKTNNSLKKNAEGANRKTNNDKVRFNLPK